MSTLFANTPVSSESPVVIEPQSADLDSSPAVSFWFSAIGLTAGFIVLIALSVIG